jgi:hypothetical protein
VTSALGLVGLARARVSVVRVSNSSFESLFVTNFTSAQGVLEISALKGEMESAK